MNFIHISDRYIPKNNKTPATLSIIKLPDINALKSLNFLHFTPVNHKSSPLFTIHLTLQRKKQKSAAHSVPILYKLNPSNTAKFNLYFAKSVATLFSNPGLYRLLAFNVQILCLFSVVYILPLAQRSPRLFVRRRVVSN